jgi:hypothetical protein
MPLGDGHHGHGKRGIGRVCERHTPEQAEQYWRKVMDDPPALALYEEAAAERSCPARDLAINDALNPPVIERIDLSGYSGCAGDVIRIWVTDDFLVIGVSVDIEGAGGQQHEAGVAEAPEFEDGPWCYPVTTTLPADELVEIHFTAFDPAVNMTTRMELFRRARGERAQGGLS